jgi:hypothetical protein
MLLQLQNASKFVPASNSKSPACGAGWGCTEVIEIVRNVRRHKILKKKYRDHF